MITPDSPDRHYSTRLRTAIVLTGSGTAGAYHAGVLRALHEAGVKIDVVAGRGVGVTGALFSALDGGPRLWDDDGIWRGPAARRFYTWRTPLRAAGWALLAAGVVLAIPLILVALAVLVGLLGLALTLVGLERAGSAITLGYTRWVEVLFAPDVLPTLVPRLVLVALLAALAALAAGLVASSARSRARRRVRHGILWRLLGVPLAADAAVSRVVSELWNLIRGAAPLAAPAPRDLARRYVEALSENLGQPGFRELLLVVHDLDARRDLLFGLLKDPHRQRFFGRPVFGDPAARSAEAFDLAGVARDHLFDVLAASLVVPVATDPHLLTFPPEGPWRGETHRVCDRPGSLTRLLEEAHLAGVEQVIVVAAAPPAGHAHELSAGRADLRGRAGEQLGAFETAALRDVAELWTGRFAGLFVIRPAHNPLGPLDFEGAYDERSDRRYTLAELIDRGYDDAYRQFIEPVVGASGERMESVR